MKKEETAARDQEIVEKIHRTSLRILEEIGMAFLSQRALEQLRQGGIRVEGNRAYFTEKQVMDAMDAAVKDFTVYARNEKYNVRMNTEDLYMTPGYGSPSVCEADGTVRPATFDDFLKLAEIVQQSEEFFINGGILAQPSDIDPEISAEVMVYATLCRSDKALFSVCGGGVQAENIMKMMRIVFGGDITEIPCTFNLISTLSPWASRRTPWRPSRSAPETASPWCWPRATWPAPPALSPWRATRPLPTRRSWAPTSTPSSSVPAPPSSTASPPPSAT